MSMETPWGRRKVYSEPQLQLQGYSSGVIDKTANDSKIDFDRPWDTIRKIQSEKMIVSEQSMDIEYKTKVHSKRNQLTIETNKRRKGIE